MENKEIRFQLDGFGGTKLVVKFIPFTHSWRGSCVHDFISDF